MMIASRYVKSLEADVAAEHPGAILNHTKRCIFTVLIQFQKFVEQNLVFETKAQLFICYRV